MRLSFLLVLSAVLAVTACGGRAPPLPWTRSGDKPRDENYHGGPAAMLLQYDADHDGTVTRDELIAGLKAEFASHDPRHTGCLTPDQVSDINQQRVEADQSTATPLMDWNNDGCIDYNEFSAAPYSLFDQMDVNRDGKLTPKELNPRAKRGKRP